MESSINQNTPPRAGRLFLSLLKCLLRNGGSDLHVSANNPPMIRVRGQMEKIDIPPFKPDEVKNLVYPILGDRQRKEFEEKKSVDFSFQSPGIGVFRAHLFHQRHGMAFVLRLLPMKPPTLDELRMPPVLKKACSYYNGLILLTGPTGSGKSTTLAAMIDYINEHQKGHIVTIEDPIEYIHESKKCLVNQRSLGHDFVTFGTALRAAMREDPDVILVGEMRDQETMMAAIHAAETGHLVLSTLHTNSAAKTIDRIISSFASGEQAEIRTVLAETLRLVVSQKLVLNFDKTKLKCFQDILVNNEAVANLIREGKTFQIENSMLVGKKDGMQIMDVEIAKAVERGDIRASDAYEIVNDRQSIDGAMVAQVEVDEGIKDFVIDVKERLLKDKMRGQTEPQGEKTAPQKPPPQQKLPPQKPVPQRQDPFADNSEVIEEGEGFQKARVPGED